MENEQENKAAESTVVAASPDTQKNDNVMAKIGVPGAIVVAGILVAGAIIFSGNNGGGQIAANNGGDNAVQPAQPSQKELLALAEIQKDDWVLGNRDAEVYIIEFSDTECPFCKRFHETMNQIVEQNDGEVAWVYRHFPLAQLHSKAIREAEATECAGAQGGSDAFWKYTNRLYEITPSNDGLQDSQLFEIAEFAGLDIGKFTSCLENGDTSDLVQEDFVNAQALGGRGTPHSIIVVGDQLIPVNGAQPFDVVQGAIDAALAQQ